MWRVPVKHCGKVRAISACGVERDDEGWPFGDASWAGGALTGSFSGSSGLKVGSVLGRQFHNRAKRAGPGTGAPPRDWTLVLVQRRLRHKGFWKRLEGRVPAGNAENKAWCPCEGLAGVPCEGKLGGVSRPRAQGLGCRNCPLWSREKGTLSVPNHQDPGSGSWVIGAAFSEHLGWQLLVRVP